MSFFIFDMNYIPISFFGFLLSLLIRSFFVYLNRSWFAQGFVGDSSVHFSIAKNIKKNRKVQLIDQYVIKSPNPMTYPLGFHRIGALFPLTILRKYSYLPNLVIFSCLSGFFFIYLHYVETVLLKREGFLFLIIAGCVYFASISNMVFQGPAIAYIKLSERLLSRMSTSFYFLGLFAGLYWADYVSYGLAILFGTIAFISSIFARQAILFTTPLLSLFYLDIKPFNILILTGISALVVSRQHFVRGLKHTVLLWKIYSSHTKKSEIVRNNISNTINFKSLLYLLFSLVRRNTSFQQVRWLLMNREPTRIFFYYPELFLFITLIFLSPHTTYDIYKIIIPVISILVIYAFTTTNKFNHLGEAYRYIEYNLYFLFPVFIALVLIHASKTLLFNSLSIYIVINFLLTLYHYKIQLCYPSQDILIKFLKQLSLSSESVVFPISMRLGPDICSRIDCKSFWWQPGGIVNPKDWEEHIEEYPFLKKDWSVLFAKYKVTHVIADKTALNLISWKYDFSELKLLYEDNYYIAYYVPK